MMGLRELLLIGIVVLVLYGRSGVLKSREAQAILPWISPYRRSGYKGRQFRSTGVETPSPGSSAPAGAFLFRGNRLFWFLTILAATAVGAWIVTRTLISSGAGGG
jgi:hypothetical protein